VSVIPLSLSAAAMNNADVHNQIEQMKMFILQEAKEKAEEIATKTEQEFMADRLLIETSRTIAVNAEHEKNKKDYITQKKIEKSKLLTESRFSTMRARDNKMVELKKEVTQRLAAISSDAKYRDLVRYLIAQGLMTLLEHEVTLQCRPEDLQIVQAELPKALQMFQDQMKGATGVSPTCNVSIDKDNYLPAGPKAGQQGASCAGGVVLSARNGSIVCRNTLDSRLDIAFAQLKPQVRGTLFGFRHKIADAVVTKKGGVSLPK